MKYCYGCPYQLAEGTAIKINIYPVEAIETEFISLSTNGDMYIEAGYAWDGPSGPIYLIAELLGKIPLVGKWLKEKYLKTILVPSLFHDAGYQLIRLGLLPPGFRLGFDDLLKEMCLERGMTKMRAAWVYKAVREGAEYAASPKNRRKIYEVL